MMFFNILYSFFQLTKHILLGKKTDVVLYCPQHFNRSTKGTNPYFDSIVEVCKENGVKYLIMEEPDSGTSNPRNPRYMKADAFFWIATIMRKLMRVTHKGKSVVEIDAKIAHIWDIVTFHKFRAKRYITISNSMINVLAELNSNGVVYDYQHGIIFNGHPGYFVERNKLAPSYAKSNRRVMLWGTLYRHAFDGALFKDELCKRIKVVGYPIQTSVIDIVYQERKYIVISLQITSDGEMWYKHSTKMLYECLEQLKQSGCKVLLKHHPRFNNEVDLNDVITKYPFVEFTSKSLVELVSLALFHITWSSTTSFEFANFGVPTYFLIDEVLPHGATIFYEQYHYPLYESMSLLEVMARRTDKFVYTSDCKIVKEWYDSAYAPFDKKLMLKILVGDED
ncbi:hypothetical protein [Bacteroides acidifaciens]|uniref:hypothetical protein n=2 Tax=Bacteroides acidifaciens TaxID=85831 RepID=UPI003014B885